MDEPGVQTPAEKVTEVFTLTRRPPPDRLRYLAEQLRSGADPAAVALALDATAEEMDAAEAADVTVEVHDLEWARRTSPATEGES